MHAFLRSALVLKGCNLIAPLALILQFLISRQRTTLLSILNGIGKAVFPLADFVMGQLYEIGQKYDVNKNFIFFK